MLLAHKIAREEKEKEMQEEEDSEEARSRELSEKADQAYMLYKEDSSLLTTLEEKSLETLFVSSVITRIRRTTPTPSTATAQRGCAYPYRRSSRSGPSTLGPSRRTKRVRRRKTSRGGRRVKFIKLCNKLKYLH